MTELEIQQQKRIQALESKLLEQQEALEKAKARNTYLEEQFKLAQQKQFGQSAEGHPAQGDLFNEAEEVAELENALESETQTVTYTRKKAKRTQLPADLPREVIVHDIEDKSCDCCGGKLHKMGEDKSEKLEFIPAQIKVIEHVRPKYSCRACENHAAQVKIKQAPMPASPIPKGIATPSLLSQVITSKYQYALPLYRQETMFKQHGIEISRQTMSDWIIKCASLFKPLYDKLHQILLEQSVIQADETTVNVVSDDKLKSYMWLYCTGTDTPIVNNPLRNIVLYEYQASRGGSCPVNFLQDYTGYLQVDGYQGYEQTKATLAGCWAHARRKFIEAEKAQPKGKTGKANWALNHIQKLYRVETKIKDKTADEKQAIRQKESVPLLEQYKAWLEKSLLNTLPKSKLGEALNYSLNQWEKLIRYIDDGHLSIDNNRAERAIKPFVVGRKNWLFSQTKSGANASAILYSMIETAKANGLIPYDYISYCLTQICKPDCQIHDLLPWNIKS
ncbi:IS66 family transposase [Gayadomonas joobiniege]|uniref:IS66 family transposase n=1 Tax=Gayadomonas joobiniege TaxID=1234606 RepID=UPI00035C740A|nr:IS66 family transposase [Gayadomonas joobiniege]